MEKETFYIPIRSSSIRKNPDYKPMNEKESIPGTWFGTFSGRGHTPEFIEESDICHITEWSLLEKNHPEFKGIFSDEPSLELLEKMNDWGINFQFSQDIIDVTILNDQEPYLYEYVDAVVKCSVCGAIFKHYYLQTDYLEDEEGYETATSTKCPVCKAWDCCSVEYEPVEEALKRTEYE